MSQITRGWLAFAGIGAGVIHLALVIGSPLPVGTALGVLGAAEFAWGVLTLGRDRVITPRLARVGAVAPMIAWSLLVVAATVFEAPYLASSFNFVPMAVATLFELFIAAYLSVLIRRESAETAHGGSVPRVAHSAATTSAAPTAGVYLLGMFAGGLAVAALTTPALAYTQAGINNPHSVHGTRVDVNGTYDFNLPEHPGH